MWVCAAIAGGTLGAALPMHNPSCFGRPAHPGNSRATPANHSCLKWRSCEWAPAEGSSNCAMLQYTRRLPSPCLQESGGAAVERIARNAPHCNGVAMIITLVEWHPMAAHSTSERPLMMNPVVSLCVSKRVLPPPCPLRKAWLLSKHNIACEMRLRQISPGATTFR